MTMKKYGFVLAGLLACALLTWGLLQRTGAAKSDYRQPRALSQKERDELLAAREEVWRAFFANDKVKMEKLLPAETLVINLNNREDRWADRAKIFNDAQESANAGNKLIKLEFPRTEIQAYGDVVILYTTFNYEYDTGGKRHTQSGYGTEIFVRRNGVWLNSGWHVDSGK